MRVAFWSNVRGTGCTSTDLACISIWYALMNPLSMAVVFENHKTLLGLGAMLGGDESQEHPKYRSGGMGALLREFSMYDELSVSDIDRIGEGYIGDRLVYFPAGSDLGPEQLNYHLDRYLGRFLPVLEKCADVVWMDLQAMARTNREILNESDTVVMCLPQNKSAWENIFSNHAGIHRRAFYLIGNYDESSEFNAEKLSRDYGISKNRIGAIPHIAALNDAVSRGTVVSFLMKCFQGELSEETAGLKESLDDIAGKLFKRMVEVKKKHEYSTVYERIPELYVADGAAGLYASYNRNRRRTAVIGKGKSI